MNGYMIGGGLFVGFLALLAGGVALSSSPEGAGRPAGSQQAPTPSGPVDVPPRRPGPEQSPAQPSRSSVPASGSGGVVPDPAGSTMAEARRVCWAILSVFETSSPEGQYSAFAVLRDEAGISYGVKQGTDRSGTLDAIVVGYIDAGGRYAAQLRPYVGRLAANETTLMSTNEARWPAWMHDLKRWLVAAGADPIMQRVQDQVFDRLYWRPAVNAWFQLGLRSPLALAVIFDTCIHSGGPRAISWVRRAFRAKPPVGGGDEREWIRQYVRARRNWLATHANDELHVTVYRMDAFLQLIAANNWTLATPIHIRQSRTPII